MRRSDILVQAKQVSWVIFSFQCSKPIIFGPSIGSLGDCLTIITLLVYVISGLRQNIEPLARLAPPGKALLVVPSVVPDRLR
jgi:hypothetical protein